MQLCSKCGESCRSTLNICPTCTHFETFKVGQEVRRCVRTSTQRGNGSCLLGEAGERRGR